MTTAARMIVTRDENGRQYLAGTLRFDLKANAMVMLRKADDGSYSLVALSGDGRRGDRSESTLFSFVLPTEQEMKQRELFT